MTEPYGRSHQHPLVGRSNELSLLRQVLQSTEQSTVQNENRRTCVLLEGNAGIGKTRLAEEISRIAESQAWTVLWSRATPQERHTPYWLWVKVLRSILQEGLWFPPIEEAEAILFAPLVSLLPELTDFFPSPAPSRSDILRQEPSLLQAALLAVLSSLSTDTDTRVLLVLDDLHNADETSCAVLELLVHRIASLPLLIVGTYRGTELAQQQGISALHALIVSLQRDHSDSIMHLDRLNDEDISALVSMISALPEMQIQQVTKLAEGNPFFAEELVRSSLPTFSTTLTSALEAHLHLLSAACQQLLQHASVLGETFDLSVLLALKTDVREETLFDLLDEALKAKILVEQGNASHISYRFWHSILTRHFYERLSKMRRAKLHRHVAGALQHVYAQQEDEWAAAIVHHLVAGGGEQREILRYALIAADRAYSLSAYSEAAHHYHLALDALEERQHRHDDFRIEQHEDLWLSEAALSERLAECCAVQGKFAEARRLYEEVLQQWIGKESETLQRDRYHTHMVALLWCEIAWTWYDEGELKYARSCCEQGMHVLQDHAIETGSALARLRFCLASVAWRDGEYAIARAAGYKALGLFENALRLTRTNADRHVRPTRTSRTLAGDPVDLGRVHALLGPFAKAVGQSSEALIHLHAALAIFEEHSCSREIAHVCCNLADVYMQGKEYTQAQTYLQRARLLAEHLGDVPLNAAIVGNLGIISLDEGRTVEAEKYLIQSVELAEQIHDALFVSIWLVYLADVHVAQGDFAAALRVVHRALILGRTMKNIPCIGHALVTLGSIRIAQAVALSSDSKPDTKSQLHSLGYIRLLKRARSTLHRALTYKELEEDFRRKGEHAAAYVAQLLPT